MENAQPGGGNAMAYTGGEAVLVLQVPWNKARSFLRFCLGWSYADPGAPYLLHRENPQYHPLFTWLRATSATFNGLAPYPTNGSGSKTTGAYSDALPIAKYRLFIATVRFTDNPWTWLDDDELIELGADEPQRNTYFDPVPSIEVISAEGLNNIKFANGPAAGTTIPAPFGTLMSKTTKTLNWQFVPHEYVSGADTLQFTPVKIDSVVGRVNSDTFLGHAPGTLLLQAPQYTRFRFPVQTQRGVDGYFGWNIKFPMQFFDPDRGYESGTLTVRSGNYDGTIAVTRTAGATAFEAGQTVDLAFGSGFTSTQTGAEVSGVFPGNVITVTGGTGTALPVAGSPVRVFDNRFRGHQLVPRRDDLKWYGCVRSDGTSKLYPEAAFATIFEHVGAP